jgi:hypothetical protein
MAKFRFFQEKEVKTWVRDYYTVEAESLEEAIKIVEEADTSLDRLECEDSRVEFDERDMDTAMEWFCNDTNAFPERYSIHSCDLYERDIPDEIIGRY